METFHTIILILHVLGAGLLLGILFLSFLAVVKKDAIQKNMPMFQFIRKYGGPVSGIQLLTGAILMGTEWDTMGHNPLVWTKIILWVVSGFIATKVVDAKVKAIEGGKLSDAQIKAFQNANVLALLIVILIIILGVIVLETN